MLAELQGEVNKEKKQKIGEKTVNTNATVKQTQKQKVDDDEISKMLAEV